MAPMLPQNHPLRRELNDEVHARPPQPLHAPKKISYLALVQEKSSRPSDTDCLVELAARFGVSATAGAVKHANIDLGPLRVVWERHTEFMRFTFIADADENESFEKPAIDIVPEDWLQTLPGSVIVAAHVAMLPKSQKPSDFVGISTKHFGGRALVGASISGDRGVALTDFRIHEDGFSRFMIFDDHLNEWQAGRLSQRLLEIETYRMLALQALPMAQKLGPFMSRCEEELTSIANALTDIDGEDDEPRLLERLTKLQAAIEHSQSNSHYRFSAAVAYHDLVGARIDELRENRIEGLQTFGEFMRRRLAPAMNTCRGVKARQDALSERLARATSLLSTRVNLAVERQNQRVLESMSRRVKLQLRLQQTVEGLSVAAITYYASSLVGYAAKGLKGVGVPVNADIASGASVPVIAGLVWFGLQSARKRLGLEVSADKDD